jgi:hypothetical protein
MTTLTLSSPTIKTFEYISVEYSTSSTLDKSWIGAYQVGVPNEEFGTWLYTSDKPSGVVSFMINTLEGFGDWEMRFFANEDTSSLLTSVPFTLEEGEAPAKYLIYLGGANQSQCLCNGTGQYSATSFVCDFCKGENQPQDKGLHCCPSQDVCISCAMGLRLGDNYHLSNNPDGCQCNGTGEYYESSCWTCQEPIADIESRAIHICPNTNVCKSCIEQKLG